jgi:multiple sugar transport system ATP-binding protein
MNMVQAELQRDGEVLRVAFGGETLALDPEVVAERPALASYEGKPVILGIRPEDIEDAAIHSDAPPDRRLRTRVNLREALGSEVLVHFSVDSPPVLTDDTRELARDAGTAELEAGKHAGRSTFVARLSPRTEARERSDIELAIDTSRVHFFDPDTGSRIDRSSAGEPHERGSRGPLPRWRPLRCSPPRAAGARTWTNRAARPAQGVPPSRST